MLLDCTNALDGVPNRAPVVIIGGGLAGLVLAGALREAGMEAIVLESGGIQPERDSEDFNIVETDGHPYSGARDGRVRCLGGTSSLWGGALLPNPAIDFASHPAGWGGAWGIKPADLDRHITRLEHLFELDQGPYDGEPALAGLLEGQSDWRLRMPKWPRFASRNTANLLQRRIRTDPGLHVAINATVTGIEVRNGRVTGVAFAGPDGRNRLVTSGCVVIAAGAIETTRILLLLDRDSHGHLVAGRAFLGAGFHDHLSAPVARLTVRDRQKLNAVFAMIFTGNGMRNRRLELVADARQRHSFAAAFAHVGFSSERPGGFDALRDIYRAIQRRALPDPGDLASLAGALPWLTRAAWWRFVNKQLLAPDGARFDLHLVTEQQPVANNRITLSHSATDRLGQPRARIAWRVTQADADMHAAITRQLVSAWQTSRLDHLAGLELTDRDRVTADLESGGGIYHPAGTTRIGRTAADGVVSPDLQVHGVTGLHALATSVFPVCGTANPSMTLLLLGLRLAERIASDHTAGAIECAS